MRSDSKRLGLLSRVFWTVMQTGYGATLGFEENLWQAGGSRTECGTVMAEFTDDPRNLLHNIQAQTAQIAMAFDVSHDQEMKVLSEQLSQSMLIMFNGLQAANAVNDRLRSTCAALLLNSAHSIVGAVELIRHGYRLQPGLLLRSVIETLCTVIHLKVHPADLANLEHGPLDSNKTVHTARQVLPVFKSLYKLFSQEFDHIGTAHRILHLLLPYDENDALLRLNLSILRLPIWLIACTTELTFLDLVPTPRCWTQVGPDTYRFSPSEEEKAKIAEFVQMRED